MDTWEAFFREKSRRRWGRHARETAVKAAILSLLLTGIAAAVVMMAAGVR